MARETFRLEGVEKLLRKFDRLQRNELRAAIRSRLREAGRPVLARARSLAPEDEGVLARSIRMRAGRRSRRSIGIVIGPAPREALGIPPGASGYYPTHVELGTRRTPRQSYLRQAMDALLENSKRVIADGLGSDILRIAMR